MSRVILVIDREARLLEICRSDERANKVLFDEGLNKDHLRQAPYYGDEDDNECVVMVCDTDTQDPIYTEKHGEHAGDTVLAVTDEDRTAHQLAAKIEEPVTLISWKVLE